MEPSQDGYDAAYPRLLGVAKQRARRVLGDTADAEEVAQEALLRAYIAWDEIVAFAPQWVARVALNLAISRLRRRRAARTDITDRAIDEVRVDTRVDLSRAIGRLPRRQREVVLLRHVADLPERDVADLLGISTGAVKRHLHRATTALRTSSILAGSYETPDPEEECMIGRHTTHDWMTRHDPANPPDGGWADRPWDHRLLIDEDGTVDRVAVDQQGDVILDADGDEVQSGPGFDYEVAKVTRRRGRLPVPDGTLAPDVIEALAAAQRIGALFGHSWVGTEHLGLALLEQSSEAARIMATSSDALARAVAEFYEGPHAAARLRLIDHRRATSWVPSRLPNEMKPDLNHDARAALQRAVIAAGEAGRSHAELTDVARVLVDPTRSPGDLTGHVAPSLINHLLKRQPPRV